MVVEADEEAHGAGAFRLFQMPNLKSSCRPTLAEPCAGLRNWTWLAVDYWLHLHLKTNASEEREKLRLCTSIWSESLNRKRLCIVDDISNGIMAQHPYRIIYRFRNRR